VTVSRSDTPRLYVQGALRPRLYCTTALLEEVSDDDLRAMVALTVGWSHRLRGETSAAGEVEQRGPGVLRPPPWWTSLNSRGLPDERQGKGHPLP
jgi:hypothetical protein